MKKLLAIFLLGVSLAVAGFTLKLPAAEPAATQSSATTEKAMADLPKTDEEWKKVLTPEQYRVLREKGTERAFTGKYDEFFEPGTYSCAACGQVLFSSRTKFNSGCGWPAFYAAAAGDRVKLHKDYSFGMARTEVTCAHCGSHLGHVFDGETHKIDGKEQVVSRYCINSVSLKFTPDKPATQSATTQQK
jgi:peptide-methionine (R)-S-oxide reductase